MLSTMGTAAAFAAFIAAVFASMAIGWVAASFWEEWRREGTRFAFYVVVINVGFVAVGLSLTMAYVVANSPAS